MHMNDLTLEELKRNHEQAASAAGRYMVFGLYRSAAYYRRMAEAMLDRINKLEAALAQPQQEPVFWYRPLMNDEMYEGPVHNNSISGKMLRDENPTEWVPLFTSPPSRDPLTYDEIDVLWERQHTQPFKTHGEDRVAFARAIEAAHGIKETP